MMKTLFILGLSFFILYHEVQGQPLPEGYILQYQQGFSGSMPLSDFTFSDPASSGIFNQAGNYYLQCMGNALQPSLPVNMAILKNRIFGDFILEADVMSLADSNGLGEACICLGMKDNTKYYYLRLANQKDTILNSAYLVNKSMVTKLTPTSEKSVTLTSNKWHKVRIERDIVKRTILLYIDNMKIPAMRIKDYELVMGTLGFGTCRKSVRFDNIKVWAPTVIREE